jgi:hypothetical protein
MDSTDNGKIKLTNAHSAHICNQKIGHYCSSAFFAQTFDEAAAHVRHQLASEESVSLRRDSACDSSERAVVRGIVAGRTGDL